MNHKRRCCCFCTRLSRYSIFQYSTSTRPNLKADSKMIGPASLPWCRCHNSSGLFVFSWIDEAYPSPLWIPGTCVTDRFHQVHNGSFLPASFSFFLSKSLSFSLPYFLSVFFLPSCFPALIVALTDSHLLRCECMASVSPFF